MKRARARGLVILIALQVVALACTPAAASLPPPAPTPTVAPTPTAVPTRTPPPDATELRSARGNLEAGRYTRHGFVPRITFVVDGPWRAVQVHAGFFDVQQKVGSPDVIAVQFARPDGIYRSPGDLVAPDAAQKAVDALRANPSLTVVEESGSRMDGLTGLQITVENPSTADGDVPVMHVPPGPLGISPGRRLWIAFFNMPEGLVAVMVGGSVAKWDNALVAAEPVLESVTIGH
jgi:hypothetical protein